MIRKSSRPCVQLNTEGLYDSVSKNRPFVVKNIFLWEVRVGPLRILSEVTLWMSSFTSGGAGVPQTPGEGPEP